jgi:MFS family permease
MAALRQPNFQLYAVGRFASGTALTLLQAALAWQVYDISGSALQLGILGIIRFVPALLLSLPAGAVADSYDRRRILVATQLAALACSTALFLIALSDSAELILIYAIVVVVALAAAFEAPARQALLPNVVTPETFANAITVTSAVMSLAFVTGPTTAGIAIAVFDVEGAYVLHMGLITLSLVTLLLLTLRPGIAQRRDVSWSAIKEGVRFVRQRQAILGSMTLDMFAVIFGGATALLPIYATEILDVGATGYGILSASLEIGAMLMAFLLMVLPPIQRTGRALLIAVTIFGLATIVFGLSRSFPLSLAAYMVAGMADQLSVVMRTTMIQLATPDELRGRVSSLNMLFIGASNQLGAAESGLVAAATSATFAVVSGGAACLGVVAAVAAKMPELRRHAISSVPAAATPPAEQEATAAGVG